VPKAVVALIAEPFFVPERTGKTIGQLPASSRQLKIKTNSKDFPPQIHGMPGQFDADFRRAKPFSRESTRRTRMKRAAVGLWLNAVFETCSYHIPRIAPAPEGVNEVLSQCCQSDSTVTAL